LTLSACPIIDGPGWLTLGSASKVTQNAVGCPVDVHLYSTAGAGTNASPWTGWEHAIDGRSSITVQFSPGIYQTATGVIFPDGLITVIGFGPRISRVRLLPTAHDKVLMTFGKCTGDPCNGTGPDTDNSFNNTLKDITLESYDTTYRKTALHLIDVRGSTFHNIHTGDVGWHDTSNVSIGVFIEGRDTSTISRSIFTADRPMVLGGSPNSDLNAASRNLDHFVFRDIDTVVKTGGAGKNVEILPTTYLTNIVVDGQFDMNFGDYGVYWAGTSPQGSFNNHFSGMRHEQQFGTAGWAFYMTNTGLYQQQLIISNFLCCAGGNGIYLRGALGVHISDYTFTGVGVALNIAGATGPPFTHVYPLVCDRCFAQEGATLATGSTMVLSSDQKVVANDPPSFYGNNPALFAAFPSSSRFVVSVPVAADAAENVITAYTPLLLGSTTAGATTYTLNKGYWFKIGKLVHLYGHMIVNVYDAATAGQIYIGATSNFPPPSDNPETGNNQFYACALSRVKNISLPTNYTQLVADIPYSNTNVNLLAVGSGQVSVILTSTLTPVPFANGSELAWACNYLAD
jgi:hypothetical protein